MARIRREYRAVAWKTIYSDWYLLLIGNYTLLSVSPPHAYTVERSLVQVKAQLDMLYLQSYNWNWVKGTPTSPRLVRM